MGLPPMTYLVSTRLVATLLSVVPLYLIALYASFFATRLMSVDVFGLSPGVYDFYFTAYLPTIDIVYSVIKVVVFAILVVLIHCYYGFHAFGGPAGVGQAVGRAVRTSIMTLVVVNLFLSWVFWGGGSTVTITG
jgi:phospholipid/cholesterol/gamma-HCH transport system permease protein